jgi:hypothetical protein
MQSQETGARQSVVAYACMAGAIGLAIYFARLRYIVIDWSLNFFEVFMRQMDWQWAAGGFVIAIAGCVAGEKARNRGAGFPATVAVTGCLLLALAYAMILFTAVGGFARMLDLLR